MTDASPRIFRTLESSDGRDSFDAIVRAAVVAFSASKRPTERQALEFGRLVLPLFDRTNVETRRMLAASLSASPVIPRELVERLLAEPTAVAAPFLLASPLLTPADLAALGKRRDAGAKKILAARNATVGETAAAPKRRRAKAAAPKSQAPDAPPPAAPADAARKSRPSPARQRTLLSTGSPDRPTPAEPRETSPVAMPATAEETRTVLRQLATVGRRLPVPATPSKPVEADLLSLALGRETAKFFALLSAKLLLDPERTAAIEAEESGRELAAALKSLGTTMADAMTMLMMLKPAIGSDVAAFEAMERIYETLDVAACRSRFPIGPGAFAEAARHQPLHAETRSPSRQEARPAVFGRRTSIPSETSRKNRS